MNVSSPHACWGSPSCASPYGDHTTQQAGLWVQSVSGHMCVYFCEAVGKYQPQNSRGGGPNVTRIVAQSLAFQPRYGWASSGEVPTALSTLSPRYSSYTWLQLQADRIFSGQLSLKLLMNVLAKAATETLLLWLVTWENVGCSELLQIKGGLEANAGDHRDSLQTTIKPSTSPAIGTGWGWKRMEILRSTCKIGCNSAGFIFKPRICIAMSSTGTSPHWKGLQDMP